MNQLEVCAKTKRKALKKCIEKAYCGKQPAIHDLCKKAKGCGSIEGVGSADEGLLLPFLSCLLPSIELRCQNHASGVSAGQLSHIEVTPPGWRFACNKMLAAHVMLHRSKQTLMA